MPQLKTSISWQQGQGIGVHLDFFTFFSQLSQYKTFRAFKMINFLNLIWIILSNVVWYKKDMNAMFYLTNFLNETFMIKQEGVTKQYTG